MGIHFQVHSAAIPDWMSWRYETEPKEQAEEQGELEDELKAGAIKVNDLMKDDVTAQLNTIMVRGNREFTDEMLGRPEDSGKRILDIKA